MTAHRAAVLGSPIAHSLSPALHRAAYRELDVPWSYDAIEVSEDGLIAFVDSCGPEWVGFSLTMPLKTAVIPLLDRSSELVQTVGAANTVLFAKGERVGENTDVPGMVAALRQAHADSRAIDTATILGGGATGRSALCAVASMGARVVTVAIRDPRRAHDIEPLAERLHVQLRLVDWPEAQHHLDSDLVVSAVPADSAAHLSAHVPGQPGALLDVAYGPGAGALGAMWRRAGGRTADGLDLLLWQAVGQVELMTGRSAPVDAMRAALADAAV